jgi:hypothetical protein
VYERCASIRPGRALVGNRCLVETLSSTNVVVLARLAPAQAWRCRCRSAARSSARLPEGVAELMPWGYVKRG